MSLQEQIEADPPRLDGILASRGARPAGGRSDWRGGEKLAAALKQAAETCLTNLEAPAKAKGPKLAEVVTGQIDEIERLTELADAHPARAARRFSQAQGRSPILRCRRQPSPRSGCIRRPCFWPPRPISARNSTGSCAHCRRPAACSKGGPVGRKLDFLSQEFNREANTLCSKSNAVELTAIGLDLKAAIDQLREQVANIE